MPKKLKIACDLLMNFEGGKGISEDKEALAMNEYEKLETTVSRGSHHSRTSGRVLAFLASKVDFKEPLMTKERGLGG